MGVKVHPGSLVGRRAKAGSQAEEASAVRKEAGSRGATAAKAERASEVRRAVAKVEAKEVAQMKDVGIVEAQIMPTNAQVREGK